MVPFFSDRPRDASREESREESQERIPLIVAGLASIDAMIKMTRVDFPHDVGYVYGCCVACRAPCSAHFSFLSDPTPCLSEARACIDSDGNRVDQHAAGVPESG